MNTTQTDEFLLRQVAEKRELLERKRLEYLARINKPDEVTHWSDWSQCDLRSRLQQDENFCFLYYKFFILCQLIIASDKFEDRKKHGLNGVPDFIQPEQLEHDFTHSSGLPTLHEQFENASSVINEYLSGEIPLSLST